LLAAKENTAEISMKNLNDAIAKVTMGPQKRSYVITEKDKKITAVHEAGHAIIGKSIKNGDQIHEVSIIPRGNAGGYTLSRPETDDRHVQKTKLLDMITMFLGGRTAEKLFLDDISTGASNDIERATNIARNMVTEWGMSDKLGLVHLGNSGDQVFIGRDYATRASYSEKEAALIDEEVKNIINSCAKEAERILSENKSKLETMVDILLEKETIYQDEVDLIMQGKTKNQILKAIDKKAQEEENLENPEQQTQHKLSVDELISRAEEAEKKQSKTQESTDTQEKPKRKYTKKTDKSNKE